MTPEPRRGTVSSRLRSLWQQEQALLRDALSTSVFNTVGRGAGLLVPFFIAAWFGVQATTDAFFLSYAIVLMVNAVFSLVLENTSVTYISGKRHKDENPGPFVGRLLAIGSTAIILLMLLVVILIQPILALVTRYPPSMIRQVRIMIWEIAPILIFFFWTSIACSVLNAYKRFMLPALSPMFRAVVILGIAYFARKSLGIHAVIVGYVCGELLRFALLFLAVRKLPGFSLAFSWKLDEETRAFFRIAFFQAIGVASSSVNVAVNKLMAARLGEGQVSLLYYADRLCTIPVSFILGGIMVPALAHWSERYAKHGMSELTRSLKKGIWLVGSFALVIVILATWQKETIARVAFLRGRFPAADIAKVGQIFAFYLLGLVPMMIYALYTRGLLILKKMRPIVTAAVMAILLNPLISIVLMKWLGVRGIALSNSITFFVSMVYLAATFRREAKPET